MSRSRFALSLSVLLFLAACTPYRSLDRRALPAQGLKEPLPRTYARWWRVFEDRELEHYLARVTGENFDLRIAKNRIEQAALELKKREAYRSPTLDLQAGVSGSSGSDGGWSHFSDSFSLGLRAGYEVDLWGRLGDLERAALHDVRRSGYDYQTMHVTLTADAVIQWYGLAAVTGLEGVLKRRLVLAKREREVLAERYRAGRTKLSDLLSQKIAVRQLEAEEASLASQRRLYESALAVLAGAEPGKFHITRPPGLPLRLPKEAPSVDSGVLLHRPDIRSALESLAAADRRAAAAVSAQYPRFDLSLSADTEGGDLASLFDRWYLSVAASLAAPLLDGGSRSAEADRALREREGALLRLKGLLVSAAAEVQDALAQVDSWSRSLKEAREQVVLEERRAAIYRQRYLHSTEDYRLYLSASTSLLRAREREIESRYGLLKAYVGLYRATATGWGDGESGRKESR
ncbi:TolC family protein [Hydrogenimonas sp.]